MNSILLAAAGLVLSLASASPGAEKLSPEVEQQIGKLIGEAKSLYQKKDHRGSVDACLRLAALIPPGVRYDQLRIQVHYYAAKNLSLLGDTGGALGEIEKAVESGLVRMEPIENDPDFEALRKRKEYADLPAKMRHQAQKAEQRRLDALRTFDFSLTALDGKQVRKADFLGSVLIVDVWGTWCPPCRMEIPHFIELHKRYAEKGLRIVGLNSERVAPQAAEDTVRRFIEAHGIPYPCALAPPEVLRSIPGFNSFPTTLFFGRDGTPRAIEVGARGLAELEAIVKPLLVEPVPATDRKEQEGKPAGK